LKITSVESNRQWLDGGAMFGNAPRPVWEKWIAPDDNGRIPLACRCFLVEIDGKKILLETGIGAFFEPKLADRYGVENPTEHRLLENLKMRGVSEEDIDCVILSHLHFDHAGGLLPVHSTSTNIEQRLLFPNAQYVTGREAWDRALHPHSRDRASFLPELNALLQKSGRLKLIDEKNPETLFNHQISFRFTHGHTPGHLHTVLNGASQTAIFAGDLIPGQAWVHVPITMGYDRFAEKVIDEKLNLYQTCVPQKWLVLFTHDAKLAASVITKDEREKYHTQEVFPTLAAFDL
jgi:glyoxylase-like metal-dependent hydrolase (beta-lactamase superfamily II)